MLYGTRIWLLNKILDQRGLQAEAPRRETTASMGLCPGFPAHTTAQVRTAFLYPPCQPDPTFGSLGSSLC